MRVKTYLMTIMAPQMLTKFAIVRFEMAVINSYFTTDISI